MKVEMHTGPAFDEYMKKLAIEAAIKFSNDLVDALMDIADLGIATASEADAVFAIRRARGVIKKYNVLYKPTETQRLTVNEAGKSAVSDDEK